MQVIAYQEVSGASTTSLTFSSIPQTYKQLCMKWSLSGDSTSGVYYKARVQLNDDTGGTSYMFLQQRGNGSSLATDAFANAGLISPNLLATTIAISPTLTGSRVTCGFPSG